MFEQIKVRIENTLGRYINALGKTYRLDTISPLLSRMLKDYVLRPGKRVRPALFVAGYLGFVKKAKPGIYTSCLSIELLHDFMLIHDDIIDRSDTRRGRPAMHRMLGSRFEGKKDVKFTGQDLAIVAGDILYAIAVNTFLEIREEPARKEKALKRFIDAALYTGCGEFIELIYGMTPMKDIRKEDIYKIYDYKTAYYTFACPLSIGAILGGASENDSQRLFDYGICLGRAFQIKDDILGMFGDEEKIGKSVLTDLQEAKKTLLMFYTFRNSSSGDRRIMHGILSKKTVNRSDLRRMCSIMEQSGGLAQATRDIAACEKKAQLLLESCAMKPVFKKSLADYSRRILQL